MSQKTVPVLMVSIAALFIALVVIIALMLGTPERKFARERRSLAVRTLLSLSRVPADAEARSENLASAASFITEPVQHGGSVDNLIHYLSKDPGRRNFSLLRDRKRAEAYLAGDPGAAAAEYARELEGEDYPGWVPVYVGDVMALFDEVIEDILTISGIPEELTTLPVPESREYSAAYSVEQALLAFGTTWIPQGEVVATYDLDRRKIRDYLLSNKRFLRRLESIDHSWRTLVSALYNLSVNPRWLTAVSYYPQLENELNEVMIVLLAADLERRAWDLMGLIPGEPRDLGILWLPEMSYYKNIPEITGQTEDDEPTIYFAKVNLGYKFRDSGTQTWLNRRKDWLTDYFESFFSSKVKEDFSPLDGDSLEFSHWETARMKAEGIHGINKRMIATIPFDKKGVYGVRDLALVRVNLLANP